MLSAPGPAIHTLPMWQLGRNATPVAFLCNFASLLVQFPALPAPPLFLLERWRCNPQIFNAFSLDRSFPDSENCRPLGCVESQWLCRNALPVQSHFGSGSKDGLGSQGLRS